jgi:hypothetical protein
MSEHTQVRSPRLKQQPEVVFGSLEALLVALEGTQQVMIQMITRSVLSRGRGTGVSQRQYGVHVTALGSSQGTVRLPVYYCTILVATQSVLDNRPFCPPAQARQQHERCLKQQQEVYQHLIDRLHATAGVVRVLGDARILVSAPWEEPIAWSPTEAQKEQS